MTSNTLRNLGLVGVCVAILATAFMLIEYRPTPALGSVAIANEYIATSTAASTAYGAFTSSRSIKAEPGAVGQVTITGANTGIVNFYNATTTNISLRTGQVATSTILIASFPASTAAGTYVLDAAFTVGLYVDLVSGNMPTSTITYR